MQHAAMMRTSHKRSVSPTHQVRVLPYPERVRAPSNRNTHSIAPHNHLGKRCSQLGF